MIILLQTYDSFSSASTSGGFKYLWLKTIGPVDLISQYVYFYGCRRMEVGDVDDEVYKVYVAGVQGDLVKVVSNRK